MRQHKILTRTLLILSIINFALAAPVAVRGRPGVRLDANVTRDVTASSQKRQDSLAKGESTNAPGPDHAPPPSPLADILSQDAHVDSPPPTPDYVHHAPPSSPFTNILSQEAHIDTPPPTPDSLPTSPESPTGSRLPVPVGSMPVADSHPSPPSPSPHLSQPGPSAPPPSPLADILSQEAHIDTPPSTPDSLPLSPGSPTGSRLPVPVGSMPAADSHSPSPPPSPHLSQPGPPPDPLTDILSQTAYTDSPPPTPDNPGLLTGSDSVPPSPGSPTESRLQVGSMPAADSHSPPPPSSSHLSQPGPPPDPLTDILSQTAYTDSPPPTPDNPGLLTGSDSVPPSPGSSTELRLPMGSMPVAGSLSPPPPPSPHPSQLGPSEDRFPSPSSFSVNPDTLSATGPTGTRPTPPQSPVVDTDMVDTEMVDTDMVATDIHSLLNPEAFPTDFWDKVLKGKFKRRISGSDAPNLAQEDTRTQVFQP